MIREPAVSGLFYPSDKEELKLMINNFLEKAHIKFNKKPRALIVPHAGYVYSGSVAAYAYKTIINQSYDKIILLGPSHYVPFYGLAADNSDYWQTPLGKVKIIKEHNLRKSHLPHMREHSLEVQLPFLQIIFKELLILPVVYGFINHEELAQEINQYYDENTLLIVSSDLSHYLNYEEAVNKDKQTIKKILMLDENIDEDNSACGLTGIKALIRIAKKLSLKPELLKYANSGDTSGDKSRVVGYCAVVF